jgi:uncharacterized protein involved in response to NO
VNPIGANMNGLTIIAETRQQDVPAILLKAREQSAQRLMMIYAVTGLCFMLLPGTFLGVWNLISISGRHGATVSASWIQAHGHAQIFGWIGTFILGIGFYSIPKMTGRGAQSARKGWIAWALWTSGVLLRWAAGFYHLYWRVSLPLSALLELSAFFIFLQSVRNHRPAGSNRPGEHVPVWIVSVLVGTAGFGLGLLMNLFATAYLSIKDSGPAFPPGFESRFLTLLAYAFIVPTIWGFSARWLPVFLGLKPIDERMLRYALLLSIAGVALAQAGFSRVAPWLLAAAAVTSIGALHLFGSAERPAKANGWVGGSRHALTVGFIAAMVFAVGQRVLPAFAGMKVLYSTRLMLAGLLLLNVGCTLRVASQILAYENYWSPAWNALPWSAICELLAVTIFAANLLLSFKQLPAHEMKHAGAA